MGGGGRKVGTTFQELNEQVKEGGVATGGAAGMDDMEKMQEMMAAAFSDPAALEAMQAMGSGLQDMMEEMGKMDPAALQAQMEEAMKLMTQGDIMDSVLEKKDEVLANLEQTGLVPPEELAKYKADPAYFEEQMKGAFDQMKGLFEDPDMMKTAQDAMQGMQDAFSDPIITQMQELLMADEVTNMQIEELRLTLLQNEKQLTESPAMAMFQGMADEVKDEKLFRKGFMEGRQAIQEVLGGAGMGGLAGMGLGAGAGMGEL
jgi:hypothetical protein